MSLVSSRGERWHPGEKQVPSVLGHVKALLLQKFPVSSEVRRKN